jgi:hypothetical protein
MLRYSCGDHFQELDTYLHCEQSLAAIIQHPDLTNDILCDIGEIFIRLFTENFCLSDMLFLLSRLSDDA